MIIVGDSLSSDIAGGAAFGIDSCWLNPRRAPCAQEASPTYEVVDLFGIKAIL